MQHLRLKDVRPGMENLNLAVKVISIGEPKTVSTRYGDAKTAIALVEDETGRLNLKLWRNQVDLVKPGDTLRIENGFAAHFGGATEINVGSRGSIGVVRKGSNFR